MNSSKEKGMEEVTEVIGPVKEEAEEGFAEEEERQFKRELLRKGGVVIVQKKKHL